MIYSCCDENRRALVAAHPTLNGIDFLEVLDNEAPPGSPRQRTLLVRLIKPASSLAAENVVIEGGVRVRPISVEWAETAAPPTTVPMSAVERDLFENLPKADRTLVVRVDAAGDYSTYKLRLVQTGSLLAPPADFDPLLAQIDFSFKVECPSDFDCAPKDICPPETHVPIQIDYLAKDYQSFRRLMLERLAQLSPEWRLRNPADLGTVLVELLAYVADHLSYEQDAVATEAYLHTARLRTSARRHARLVDYHMHDGRNARSWVHLRVKDGVAGPVVLPPDSLTFLTRLFDTPPVIEAAAGTSAFKRLLDRGPVVFEPVRPLHSATPLEPVVLRQQNNEFEFYTWGNEVCCLSKGAVRATLTGASPFLEPGHVLVFEEILGPHTGRPADADPAKRCAVRLVEVIGNAVDPATGADITEIRWHHEDALPFDVCISARTAPEFGADIVTGVSRALGNIVLCDHGRTVTGIPLGEVPQPHLWYAPERRDRCEPGPLEAVPPRYRPQLPDAPLTQTADLDPDSSSPSSARAALHAIAADVRPAVVLLSNPDGDAEVWGPRRDLLASSPGANEFVVEVERDGNARLRFGDGRYGRRPASGTEFTATYRVGNGPSGNIGADAIAHVIADSLIVGDIVKIDRVRNPMPASGGRRPETIEEVRQRAPFAFMTQQRAVTAEDYAAAGERHDAVQRAAATFRWTGSWRTVFVTVDRFGAAPVDADFERALRAHLEPFRMAGYDLEVDAPFFVPLEVELFVCAHPDHFRAPIKTEIVDILGNRVLPDGRLGLFHPDNLTFEATIHLSAIIAKAQSVPGVSSVEATVFRRWNAPETDGLADGVLNFERLEIPRLDNDPSVPENGVLRIVMGGGK